MNEEKTNIVPYNTVSGGGSSQPKDYSNSNRSKMGNAGKQASQLPSTVRTERAELTTGDGFFKATLKQAVDHAIKTVIDPMIRNFVYSTGMSILNTLLWNGGKGSPSIPTGPGMTPYNLISTSTSVAMSPKEHKPQLSKDDRVWQRFDKCHVDTLEQAQRIMSRLYRKFRAQGQVTLADYYEAFMEKIDIEDENWGWTSLPQDKMGTVQYADGYHIFMPKLERLT